ncbi:hypothetical protein L218DRAFT_992371 [Marasmius fiardii PR-910]|nr:hypothetical protein L218DRAFT_992371 [Marasmius fiardii PR-910]
MTTYPSSVWIPYRISRWDDLLMRARFGGGWHLAGTAWEGGFYKKRKRQKLSGAQDGGEGGLECLIGMVNGKLGVSLVIHEVSALTVLEKHDTVSSFMTPHQVERTKHGRQLAAQFVLDKSRGGLAAGTLEYSPQTGIQVLGLSGNWTTVNQRKNANFWVVEAMMIAGAGVRESVA